MSLLTHLQILAAAGQTTHDFQPFFDFVLRKSFVEAGEWIWLLFSQAYADKWHDTKLFASCETVHATRLMALFLLCTAKTHDEATQICTLSLVLASGNVLTLRGHTDVSGQVFFWPYSPS